MKPIQAVSIKYGLICGVMSIFAFYVQFLLGINPLINLNSFFIDIVIFFGFIFFGAKEFKDYKNEGILHFWQGITVGMIIIFLASVIFTTFSSTYYLINQEVFKEYVQNAITVFENQKPKLLETISEEEYLQKLEDVKNTTISDLAITDFFKKAGVGFLVTPVIAVLLRKQSKS